MDQKRVTPATRATAVKKGLLADTSRVSFTAGQRRTIAAAVKRPIR